MKTDFTTILISDAQFSEKIFQPKPISGLRVKNTISLCVRVQKRCVGLLSKKATLLKLNWWKPWRRNHYLLWSADFTDLCRGAYPSYWFCKSVKLLNVAGAYWRVMRWPQLTRIYGIHFEKKKNWPSISPCSKSQRDHRVGKRTRSFYPLAKSWAGTPLWLPRALPFANVSKIFSKEIDAKQAMNKWFHHI